MATEETNLKERIHSGGSVLIAEVSPPTSGDAAAVREAAGRYAGKVHALGVTDNQDHVCMSALAAASLIAGEGVEPILHIVTRDRNRIALISECLGAQALGIHNILCTTGTHQTLGRFRAAKNVFDIDSIQLLQTYARLGENGSVVGEEKIATNGSLCLGATAAPFADPAELQLMRMAKKVTAGARFLITQPVFDLGRFSTWWEGISQQGIQEQVAVVAGVRILTDADEATQYAGKNPKPMVPDAVLERITSQGDKASQRAAGIEIAVETIGQLSATGGLRGFAISAGGDHDAALEVIERSGLGVD